MSWAHGTDLGVASSSDGGVPQAWPGHERHIRHYTSPDLVRWTFRSTLACPPRT